MTQLPLWGEDAATGRLAGPRGRAFTEEQSDAIRAREGSRLLYANAGSGKTAVIVERFVLAVLEDRVDPRRILAITFTDKAAGELKERLRERFLELGERAAARQAEGAYVSTIHGFCARLLRAHPFAAGLDPEFRVLDEAEGRRLRADCFSAALAGFFESAARTGPEALELAAAYRPDRLAKLVDTTYARLRSRGHTTPELPQVAPRLVPPGARDRLAEAQAALAARLAAGPSNATVDKAQVALERCRVLLSPGGHPLPAELDRACFSPGNAVALRLDETGDYLDALAAYRTAVADSLAAQAWCLLAELLTAYGTEYERRKRERSALDFEDLELMARDLLREQAAVRRAYAERFELLMVDEFQDTNARQLEILELLERDNLLTVGDEFQSIYGFRHADVELFRDRRETLHGAGRAASLAANFRARGPLLDVINEAFEPLFGDGFVALADGRDDARELEAPLVDLLVTDQRGWDDVELGDLPPTSAYRHAEARLLADRVAGLVEDGSFAPGDIAVLVRALTDLPVYERALEERGLKTYVAGARGYWSAQQVRDLVAYLSALANPRDELRLFELLASPLGGLSSDGLAVLAQQRRRLRRDAWWALEQAFCEGGDGSDGLAEALPATDADRLRELCPWLAAERAALPRHGLDELIERAVAARGYDLHALSLRNGPRRYANVRKLLRLAREFEAHEGRDLRRFLDWVAVREDTDVAEAEAPVETEGMDAVRLMSIHAAKGLEFPVVCVADTGRQGPGDAPDVHVAADGRVGLKLVSLDGDGVAALDWQALQDEAQAAANAEEHRVFYVALTRARERLIVSGTVRNTDRVAGAVLQRPAHPLARPRPGRRARGGHDDQQGVRPLERPRLKGSDPPSPLPAQGLDPRAARPTAGAAGAASRDDPVVFGAGRLRALRLSLLPRALAAAPRDARAGGAAGRGGGTARHATRHAGPPAAGGPRFRPAPGAVGGGGARRGRRARHPRHRRRPHRPGRARRELRRRAAVRAAGRRDGRSPRGPLRLPAAGPRGRGARPRLHRRHRAGGRSRAGRRLQERPARAGGGRPGRARGARLPHPAPGLRAGRAARRRRRGRGDVLLPRARGGAGQRDVRGLTGADAGGRTDRPGRRDPGRRLPGQRDPAPLAVRDVSRTPRPVLMGAGDDASRPSRTELSDPKDRTAAAPARRPSTPPVAPVSS